jgi:hypothetical protein
MCEANYAADVKVIVPRGSASGPMDLGVDARRSGVSALMIVTASRVLSDSGGIIVLTLVEEIGDDAA